MNFLNLFKQDILIAEVLFHSVGREVSQPLDDLVGHLWENLLDLLF